MNDNYNNLKYKHEEYLAHFPLLNRQTGLIAIIDNGVRGIEYSIVLKSMQNIMKKSLKVILLIVLMVKIVKTLLI